jgi:hypothetical protein
MLKYVYYSLGLLLLGTGLFVFSHQGSQADDLHAKLHNASYRVIKNHNFGRGEYIEYLLHYGVINAGIARINVDNKLWLVNDRICYKVDVAGETTGALKLYRVEDLWRSYIDTAAIAPHRFYRYIAENKYRREERIDFNPLQNKAKLSFEQFTVQDKEKKKSTTAETEKLEKTSEIKDVVFPANFRDPQTGHYYPQDIVSGYYYLRTIDYDKQIGVGNKITIPAIFEDQTYNFSIRYDGREVVDTKFGKVNAFKFTPMMGEFENDIFTGDGSLVFWVSDDANRIPVKVEAKIFLGKVVLEITNHRNLKAPFNFAK